MLMPIASTIFKHHFLPTEIFFVHSILIFIINLLPWVGFWVNIAWRTIGLNNLKSYLKLLRHLKQFG